MDGVGHPEVDKRLAELRAGGHNLVFDYLIHLYVCGSLDEETLYRSPEKLLLAAKEEKRRLKGWRHAAAQICASTKKTRKRGLAKKTIVLREVINEVLKTSSKPVTVRQIFYLVSTRNAVEKTEAGYRKVARQLRDMRREKLIPYPWIADLTRWQRKPRTYGGLTECLNETANFYRAAVWRDLPVYVEIWCEKRALAGVLYEETERFDVPLMVTGGYTSESFAYEAAHAMPVHTKKCIVYYLGDQDPSGWDISRDLEHKLRHFSGGTIQYERLAVTPEQVDEWELPSRPSKRTDTRHRTFEQEFGDGAPSVELDAIPPDDLRNLVRHVIEQHIPAGHLEAIESEEEAAKETLNSVIETLGAADG